MMILPPKMIVDDLFLGEVAHKSGHGGNQHEWWWFKGCAAKTFVQYDQVNFLGTRQMLVYTA